jgi:hypothetical protein
LLVLAKINTCRLEEEHTPAVIVTDIGLIGANALKISELIVPLEQFFNLPVLQGNCFLILA